MIETLETNPPKYADLYNFLSSNNIQGINIPNSLEEFAKEYSSEENAKKLHLALLSNDKLKPENKEFKNFSSSVGFEFDQEQKGDVNLNVSKAKDNEGIVPQSNEITSEDDVKQEFIKRENHINKEYDLNKAAYKKQKEKNEIDERRYLKLIQDLDKKKNKDFELNLNKKTEDLGRIGVSNPIVTYYDYNKKGDKINKRTGVHDWMYRQPSEKDLDKGDTFFKMKGDKQKELFIPFLQDRYPGYDFKYNDPSSFGVVTKAATIDITNKKDGSNVLVDLNKGLSEQKKQIANFINEGGNLDVSQLAINMSNSASKLSKVYNTPFNSEEPRLGGIGLNEGDRTDLSSYGVFKDKKTDLGVVKEFEYNKDLFTTPREYLADQMVVDGLLTAEEAKNPYSETVATKMLSIMRDPKYSTSDDTDRLINYSEMRLTDDGYVFEDEEVQEAFKEVGQGDWTTTKKSYDRNISSTDDDIGQMFVETKTSMSILRKKAGIKPPTEEEVKRQVARNLYEKNRAEALDSHWDAYIAKLPESNDGFNEQSLLLGASLTDSDANIDKSIKLQSLNSLELQNINDPNTEDNLLLDYFDDIYNDPSKDFPQVDGEMVKFKNGKTASKALFDQYDAARNGKISRMNTLLKRRQEVWDLQDESGDIDKSLDLLGRDYNIWRKSIANTLMMFGDIGLGVGYLGSKAIKGVGYAIHGLGSAADGDISWNEWEEQTKIWDDFDDAFADWGQEWTDTKEKIRSNFSKDVNFHQDKWGGRGAFSGEFGSFVAQEVSTQLPILLTMMASGGTAGPLLIGAYSAGDHWMQDDMEDRRTGVYRSEWKQAAAALGYGAAEAVFERLTTVPILRRGGDLISKMGQRSIFDYKEGMKRYFKSQLPMLPLESASEMVGEGLTQVTQNMIDGRPTLENVDHAMFVGGMFGFGMSSAPFIAGAAAQSFTDYGSMSEFRNISVKLTNLEIQKAEMLANGANIDVIEKNISNLKSQQKVILDNKFNQMSKTLSGQAMNSIVEINSEQENIRANVKEIINNPKLSKQVKQQQLKDLKDRFDKLEYAGGVWKNSGAFGNDWILQKEQNPERYNSIIAQAKDNLKANNNKIDDVQESAIQDEAYKIYVGEEIDANFKKQKAINEQKGLDVQLLMAETNKDAGIMLDNMESEAVEKLKKENASEETIDNIRKEYKGLKEALSLGIVNGVDIRGVFTADGKTKSLIFKETAVKNDKRQVGTHEIGHWAFSKLISRNSDDFISLAKSIEDYLNQTSEGRNVLTRIKVRDSQTMSMADELVMNFLEEVGNETVPISPEFASLFGFATNEGLSKATNGEMNFDFKGSDDAVAFVIGLGKAISSGQLTADVIEQAKESKVIKDIKESNKARNNKIIEKVVANIKKSGVAETDKEKRTRQDNRNKLLDKVYNEQALDEDGKPVGKQEFGEFLKTRKGKDFVAEVLMMSYNDMLAIVKGDELKVDFNPLIKHIEAFNPQKKIREGKFDLKGYFGRFLKVKTQTGSKQVAKTDMPKGAIRIDQKREGARDIEIKDTSKTPDIDTETELNFRNKLNIETGGDLYNSILKKAKIILSTLSTNLTVPKTNTTLKEVKAKLKENPNNNESIKDLNKIFKEFRKTLKNAFDTQLFKEIKNSMGTRNAYNDYLISNKEAILTGLPIADLVAMQKAKSANKILVKTIKENLSPNEIKQYEGSSNLMYTSPTSGPTVYERLNSTDEEFVKFMNVRGRKDALARNIAGKLGEDATMQTLASEDVIDSFLIKNPTLKNIPTDMLSNSIAQAIDSGVGMKFSSNAQKEVFKQNGSEFINNLKNQNLGTNKKAIESALYKTFINENPTKVWGETIEEQQKNLSKFAKDLVNPINKYLKPEGKTSLKSLKAVPSFGEFTLEEIAQKELATNLVKVLDLKTNNLAKESEASKNVTFMRELEADFIKNLVEKYGKVKAVRIAITMLKGHNATSGKIGATNLGVLSELNEEGKRRQPRYQYFESLEDFVNSTLNTIPGVDIKIKYTKGKSPKGFVESIVIDKKPIELFESRESQKSKSKKHFEETYNKREKESQEAWDVLIEYLDFMYDNGNNLSFALTMMALKSNMDSILKSSALAKYYYVGPEMNASNLRYEHMIPTEYVAIKLTQHFVSKKIDLQALKDKYNVAIIPKAMDNNLNVQLQKSMPSFWNETLSETERYFNDLMLGYQNMYALEIVGGKNKGDIIGENFLELNNEVIKAKDSNVKNLSNDVVKFKKSETNNDIIGYAKTIDKALSVARDPNAPVRKIRVFDFDDTLATTKSDVLFTTPDGTKGKLNAEEFAKQGSKLLEEGYVFDFSEFNKVTDGKPGPLLDIAKKIQEARGTEDVFVLTARAPEAQVAIKEFLDSVGLNIPLKNITGLGNSTGAAKANWIVDKAANGYNDFYFADDAYQNVQAVQDALDQIDVKSEVQQAKIKFSGNVNEDFNMIIEESKGVDYYKTFSDAKARVYGKRNEKARILPYSAEDFEGLIYPLLGKGKQGEKHYKWFDDNLFKPFARAMSDLSIARINVMDDFKKLKEALEIPKDLKKKNKSGFTNEVAVRVYIWNKLGETVPGISKRDSKDLENIVNSDGILKAFADQIIELNKGKYIKPSEDWLGGTISTDLITTLNSLNRKEYLKEWKENKDLIFTKENLNKLEAIFGPKYREALENSLKRMERGSNRLSEQNRIGGRILDYLNNSQGVVMFLNMRSALLQNISSINFLNWSFNNPLKAAASFANQTQYWKDFMTLMNSDYLVDRRNGLRINVSESEISEAAKTSQNKAKAAVSWIIQKGYAPTQFADSFAIASGGSTWYRNRIKDLIDNEGMTEKEAKDKTMLEFREIAEKSQQSSRPDKISQQQSSDTGRLLLNWANTQQQYVRIQAKAIQDLVKGRGDYKEHVSKIIYYGVVQSLIFNAAQQALFALGFGDDDEDLTEKQLEKKKSITNKKYIDLANGTADGILRGLGIGGHIISVLKNTALDIYRRSERSRPEYSDAMWKLIQMSPVISSKVSRLKQAAWHFDSKKRRQEMLNKGFNIDNPAYTAAAKVVSAVTNVPLDRALTKFDNIKEALNEENDVWMRVALLMGWRKWQLQMDLKESKSSTKKSNPFTVKKQKSKNPFASKRKKNTNPFAK